jgi:hypothetical protein
MAGSGLKRVRAPAAAVAAADAAADKGVDLDTTFNNSEAEQAAGITYRPNIGPTNAIGSQFEPFNAPERPLKSIVSLYCH